MSIAACLIVKDEESHLGACLDSLRPLVDEVVVVDTGSSDATAAVARAHGVLLLSQAWTGDFAAARNTALAAARADWVLSIDADERAAGTGAALRRQLAAADGSVDAFAVEFDDLDARSGAYSFRAPRLFRRAGARWAGRVHERVVRAGRDVRGVDLAPAALRITHLGYRDLETVQGKAARNLRLAGDQLQAQLGDPATPGPALALSLLDLGRSALSAGELQTAVDALEALRELEDAGDRWRRATDFLTRVMIVAGEHEVALHLAGELLAGGGDAEYVGWLRGQALGLSGRPAEALAALAPVRRVVDPGGCHYAPAALEEFRALCGDLAALGARTA
ncbi:glycosyltransferase [Kineococcus sp. R8]|uniref:glycosyltransferase n=1 Tax=Kineococcus siccus TaxID=2696567 RepID=UPI0014130FB6|nr:glycosyltransferase [Kineococcus siccus]